MCLSFLLNQRADVCFVLDLIFPSTCWNGKQATEEVCGGFWSIFKVLDQQNSSEWC
jgi:hypothetical protein